MKQSICLNMIVKNEGGIIKETLTNLCKYITFKYWVILDTGSTDNTKQVIIDFFKNEKIKGKIIDDKWIDFGTNRTNALKAAYNKTDYVLIFDADDKIMDNFKLPPILQRDSYKLKFGPSFVYYRPLLVNNRKKWKFVGVLHEYIKCEEPSNGEEDITGDYYLVSGRTGNRSQDPEKYKKDAVLLKAAFEKEIKGKDQGLATRYAFYCAQSYKDCQNIDDSIIWYLKCIDLGNWVQEKYYSCIMLGDFYMGKKDPDNAIKYWLKSSEYDIERIECVVKVMEYYQSVQKYDEINKLYHKFKNYNKIQHNKLFLLTHYANDEIEYNNSIASQHIDDKLSGYICCKKILTNNVLPVNKIINVINVMQFHLDFFKKDKYKTKMLESLKNIIIKNNLPVPNHLQEYLQEYLIDYCQTLPILDNYIFIPHQDHINDDLYYHNGTIDKYIEIADNDPSCVGFNTLGYFKHTIFAFMTPSCFKEKDGIYIKKEYYNKSCMTLVANLNKNLDDRCIYTIIKSFKFMQYVLIPVKSFDFTNQIIRQIQNNTQIFFSTNPCIIPNPTEDGYIMNIRYLNYLICNNYWTPNAHFITLNKYVKLSSTFEILSETFFDIEYQDQRMNGIEDIRIFNNNGLKFLGTTETNNKLRVSYGDYDINSNALKYTAINSPFNQSCEKNWVYVILNNKLHIIYKWFPLTIGVINNNELVIVNEKPMPNIFKSARGTSCGFIYNNEIWFLVHFVSYSYENANPEHAKNYFHTFVIFDLNMDLIKYSSLLKFTEIPIEFAIGLIVENDRIIISYGEVDKRSKIVIYDKKYIDNLIIYGINGL